MTNEHDISMTFRLIAQWHHGYDYRLLETCSTHIRGALQMLLPEMGESHIESALQEFREGPDADGARIAGFAWSWIVMVPATDMRPPQEVASAAIKRRLALEGDKRRLGGRRASAH